MKRRVAFFAFLLVASGGVGVLAIAWLTLSQVHEFQVINERTECVRDIRIKAGIRSVLIKKLCNGDGVSRTLRTVGAETYSISFEDERWVCGYVDWQASRAHSEIVLTQSYGGSLRMQQKADDRSTGEGCARE